MIRYIFTLIFICGLNVGLLSAMPNSVSDSARDARAKRQMLIEPVFSPLVDTLDIADTSKSFIDSVSLSADVIKLDSITIVADSLAADSTLRKRLINDPVMKSADDSIVYDIADKKIFMYKNAKVVYGDKQIEADYIEFDSQTKVVYACGVLDTAGKLIGKPKFKDGDDSYEMEKLYYNFDSKKARIIGVVTQQGEAYMHGSLVKKMPDNTTFSKDALFTTCNAKHPHFYIKMSKAKMIPAKKEKRDKNGKIIQRAKNGQVVFGFSHLVVEDVPLPIFTPWGFFPIVKGNSSGIIFPSYGEETERGFYLQGFGYYFMFGDYADLTATGDWYSKGSWAYQLNSRYVKRYKFSGNLGYEYSTIKTGDKGSPDYNVSKSYAVRWSHQKAPQSSPTTTFQASVNFYSSSHKKYNDKTMNDYLTNQASSSISFSKTWEGTPFSMTAGFTHSQNMRDSTYSFGFPTITFAMSRIYPFKNSNRVGKKKFYEDIGFSYNMNFSNSVNNIKEDYLFKDKFWDAMRNGMQHSFSISLPSFTIAKYINASPSISYGQTWFFQSAKKHWVDPGYISANPSSPSYVSPNVGMVTDTTSTYGDFGISHTYSGGLSLTTHIYGLFDRFGEKSKIRAIRHVMTPSLSFSYTPNQMIAANGWRKVTNPQTGEVIRYNIYNSNTSNLNSASGSGPSGSINFTLGNTLEMKVRSDKDTSDGGEKKIKLLESFNISTSYNLLADSMNLSNIVFNGRTNLFDKVGITFGFTLDPYDVDYRGNRINQYYFKRHHFSLGRLTAFNWATDYTFSGGKGKGSDTKKNQDFDATNPNNAANGGMPVLEDDAEPNLFGPNYVNFSVPWSLSLGWSYYLTKSYSYNSTTGILRQKKNHNATLSIRGDLNLTENWKITASTGYDVSARKITSSQFSLHRDLHCFEFSFSWIPFGFRKSWSFTIRAKSSMISDAIKYDKHSSFYDN